MTTQIIVTAVCYFVFSAAVGAMAPPCENQERGFYGWIYRTLQRLAANADRLAQSQFLHIPKLPDAGTDSFTSASSVERRVEVTTNSASK